MIAKRERGRGRGPSGAALIASFVVCVLLWSPGVALAQEAINMPAATQPSADHWVYQAKLYVSRYDDDPTGADRRISQVRFNHRVQYGISGDLSAQADIPLIRRRTEAGGDSETEAGLGDLTLTFKRRVVTRDLGPVDTVRVSVFGGAQLPTGNEAFSSDSVDPVLGAVLTAIVGRHGFNQSMSYLLTTGDTDGRIGPGESLADLIRFDSSYLYRLAPEAYGSEYVASWYAVLELNGTYETNGDTEIMLSPGLLYEGTTWAAEAGVQLPVYQDTDERPETAFSVVAGLRFLY